MFYLLPASLPPPSLSPVPPVSFCPFPTFPGVVSSPSVLLWTLRIYVSHCASVTPSSRELLTQGNIKLVSEPLPNLYAVTFIRRTVQKYNIFWQGNLQTSTYNFLRDPQPFINVHVNVHSYLSVHRLRLRNDLYCVEWGVKLYSITHSLILSTVQYNYKTCLSRESKAVA